VKLFVCISIKVRLNSGVTRLGEISQFRKFFIAIFLKYRPNFNILWRIFIFSKLNCSSHLFSFAGRYIPRFGKILISPPPKKKSCHTAPRLCARCRNNYVTKKFAAKLFWWLQAGWPDWANFTFRVVVFFG
jgi:hypothetical protein